MINKQSMSIERARCAVEAVLAALEPGDKPVAVVVSDDNGEPIYAERMDGASANDMRQAERKAYSGPSWRATPEAIATRSRRTVAHSLIGRIQCSPPSLGA